MLKNQKKLFKWMLPLPKLAWTIFIVVASNNIYANQLDAGNDINSLAGGIGVDETNDFFKDSHKWTLMIIFSEYLNPIDFEEFGDGYHQNGKTRSAWVADVKLKITDSSGKTYYSNLVDGPLLLINLPSGDYLFEASYKDVERRRWLSVITGKHQKIWMHW